MLDKFSEETIQVLDTALAEAFWHKQNFACLEYILLGLSRHKNDVVVEALVADYINYQEILAVVESLVGRGCLSYEEDVLFTPLAQAAIEKAAKGMAADGRISNEKVSEYDLVQPADLLMAILSIITQTRHGKQTVLVRLLEELEVNTRKLNPNSCIDYKINSNNSTVVLQDFNLKTSARKRVEKALSSEIRNNIMDTSSEPKIEELMKDLVGYIRASNMSPSLRTSLNLPQYDTLKGVYLSGDDDFVILSKNGIYWSNEDLDALFVSYSEVDSFRLVNIEKKFGLEIQSLKSPPLILNFPNDDFAIHNDRQKDSRFNNSSREPLEFARNSIKTVSNLPELCQWLLDGNPEKEVIDKLSLNLNHFNHQLLSKILDLLAESQIRCRDSQLQDAFTHTEAGNRNSSFHPDGIESEEDLIIMAQLNTELNVLTIEEITDTNSLINYLQNRTKTHYFIKAILLDLKYLIPSHLKGSEQEMTSFCRLIALLLSAPFEQQAEVV